MLTYLSLFTVSLILPGWLITRVVLPSGNGFLYGFSVSVVLLIANVGVFVWLRLPYAAFTPTVLVEMILLAAWSWRVAGGPLHPGRLVARARRLPPVLAGAGMTTGIGVTYLAYAGVYTEVPADVWRHLGYIQSAYQAQMGDRPPLVEHLWYYIPAWLWRLSGDDVFAFVEGFGKASTLVQALGLYMFSYSVVRPLLPCDRSAVFAATLSVVVAAFSIGVNVFSYIRYYTFGPFFPNMLLYLCGVLLVLDLFQRRSSATVPRAAILVLLCLAMYVVHDQEAAFLYALVLALSVVTLAGYLLGLNRRTCAPARAPFLQDTNRWGLYAAAGLLGLTGLAFLWSRYNLPVQGALHPWIVPLSSILPAGDHLYIGNPSHQIYRSLTVWGLLVYALFLVHLRAFLPSRYLLAGMLLPLATVFNPLFVDLFIRYSDASPLYRFMYAVPLHIVASCCLVHQATRLSDKRVWHKGFAALGICVLVIPLFPNGLPALNNPYSRFHTLRDIPAGNDFGQWKDVLEFLGSVERTRVISDPVTSYLVRGMTHHRASGYKFHRAYVPLDRDVDYYARFPGAVIVLNHRDGGMSANGRRAGHWPTDVLKVSRYYPDTIDRLVREHPRRFELIWERNRVRIYRIASKDQL